MAAPKSVFRINNATAAALGVTEFYDAAGNIVVNCDFGDDLLPSQVMVIEYVPTTQNAADGILPPKRHTKN